jgi:hypothetical protein
MGVTFVKLKSAGEVMLTTGAGTSVTLVLADAELPAASVAVTEIVPTPVLSEVLQVNPEPLSCAAAPLHETLATPEAVSLAVPETGVCVEYTFPDEGEVIATVGGVLSSLTRSEVVAVLPARSVAAWDCTVVPPSLLTGTGAGQLATPLRLSLHWKLTVRLELFQPALFGAGVRVGVIVGGLRSMFTLADAVAVCPL